jgi:hypothetical protein
VRTERVDLLRSARIAQLTAAAYRGAGARAQCNSALIGRRVHHEDAGVAGFFRVLWPFAVGLAVAWLATGLFRSPLSWRRAVSAWILTVAIGVVLRIAVQGHDFSVAFTIVATLFVGACMLGWRVVVLAVQQRRRMRLGA